MTFLQHARRRARRSAWIVWATGCGVYFLAVLHRSSLGVAGPEAVERLHITSAQLGIFVMLQLGVYAVMQIPSGLAIDRWGPRRVLLVATLVLGIAQTTFAFATTYPVALGARALLGVGDAAVYISCLRLAAQWFPATRYAGLTMITGMVGMAGNLAATVPLTIALQTYGWTRTFAVTGITSLLYAVLLLRPAVAAPYREVHLPGPEDALGDARTPRAAWRSVLGQVLESWRGGERGHGARLGFWTHQATMASGTVLAMVWGYPYLTEGLGYPDARAAAELSLFVVATLAFSLVIGPVAGRWRGSRMPLAIAVCAAILLAWLVLLGWPGGRPPELVVTLAFVVIATGGPASQIGFHLARDYTPQTRISTATGLVNAGGFLGAMVGAVTVGLVLDARSGGATPDLDDYRWALATVVAIAAVSTLAMVASLLRLRGRALARVAAGEPVVVPVVAHWWDLDALRPHVRVEDEEPPAP